MAWKPEKKQPPTVSSQVDRSGRHVSPSRELVTQDRLKALESLGLGAYSLINVSATSIPLQKPLADSHPSTVSVLYTQFYFTCFSALLYEVTRQLGMSLTKVHIRDLVRAIGMSNSELDTLSKQLEDFHAAYILRAKTGTSSGAAN